MGSPRRYANPQISPPLFFHRRQTTARPHSTQSTPWLHCGKVLFPQATRTGPRQCCAVGSVDRAECRSDPPGPGIPWTCSVPPQDERALAADLATPSLPALCRRGLDNIGLQCSCYFVSIQRWAVQTYKGHTALVLDVMLRNRLCSVRSTCLVGWRRASRQQARDSPSPLASAAYCHVHKVSMSAARSKSCCCCCCC